MSGGSSLLRIGAKKEVTCPACGAGYTVVCKDPDSPGASSSGSEQTWNPVDGSSDMWELKNSAGKYVRFYERADYEAKERLKIERETAKEKLRIERMQRLNLL